MSRVSRYGKPKEKQFKVALYVRLSNEDKKNQESESVKSQKIMLESFVSQMENIADYKFYVDDGYSGGNFNRPAFETMLNDISEKKINCIIVKDFSRLGRNYKLVGNYLQVIFPTMNVRFISIINHYDSLVDFIDMDTLAIALDDLMNEQYIQDCSVKSKLSYTIRRNKGQFTSPFAPYGYEKDKYDLHKLVIDENVAPIVKFIYDDFLERKSIIGVVKDLSEKHILSPSEYKQTKNPDYYTNKLTNKKFIWNSDSVKTILTNEVYIGNMVQHKRETIDYKTKKVVKLAKTDWIKVENTHQAIIDKETFYKVQEILKLSGRKYFVKSNKENTDNYFSGVCYCGNCGSRFTYVNDKNRKYTFYKCRLHCVSKQLCNNEYIKTETLINVVLPVIQKYIQIACDLENLIKQINSFKLKKGLISNTYNKESNKVNIEKLEYKKSLLYQDYRENKISLNEYKVKKEKIDNMIQQLNNECKENISPYKESIDNLFIKKFTQYKNINSLTKEIVKTLINKIIIYDNNKVEIIFNFKDEFEEAKNYIEKNNA